MGCFLGCFGGSKDRKRLKNRKNVLPPDKQSYECSRAYQNYALSEQKPIVSSPISLVSDLQDRTEEKSSSSGKKCVTFDSNVNTSEQVSALYESKDSFTADEIEQQTLVKVTQPLSSSEENSVASSVGSYPPNYRYQNCRDSDDDIEECGGVDSGLEDVDCDDDDYEEDYFNDDDNGDCAFVGQEEEWRESALTASMESTTRDDVSVPVTAKDVNVREKSDDIHPVLNPVENLTQWKSVNTKGGGACQLTLQKENIISFASETAFMSPPSFVQQVVKQSSSCVKPKSAQSDGVAVDASLSSWLITASESSTPSYTNNCVEIASSEKSSKSKYVRNLDDRPILGALTVEELKQFSKNSSPRKSPSQSPDETPIIGTVGTYWNDSMLEKDSQSVSSYKGIPNTNSKYREDKKVNWHSTPFEKRLERALNRASEETLTS